MLFDKMSSPQDISYIADKLKMLTQKYPDDVPDDKQRIFVTLLQRNLQTFFATFVYRYKVCYE